MREVAAKLVGERPSRRPAEQVEQQASGSGGSDRMRVISVADSGPRPRDPFRIYMLRLATLAARGPQQYSLGWKQSGRGAADGKRPEDGSPAFAEMADPGTAFEGVWRENEFLNREAVRQVLRWNAPLTRERLFVRRIAMRRSNSNCTRSMPDGQDLPDLAHPSRSCRESLRRPGTKADVFWPSAGARGFSANRRLLGLSRRSIARFSRHCLTTNERSNRDCRFRRRGEWFF